MKKKIEKFKVGDYVICKDISRVKGLSLGKIYIVYEGYHDEKIKFDLISMLRNNNYICLYTYDVKSLKAQLKEADKLNCKFCLILGEEELKDNLIVVRSLEKGTQDNIPMNDFNKDPGKYLN